MNKDTQDLLKECTAGCQMAINSMDQILNYVEDAKLQEVITECRQEHIELEKTAADLLGRAGHPEKEPDAMASAFSWASTGMKMMVKQNSHEIAKIMMDGCNMGIQSVSEYRNKYKAAESDADDMAKELIRIEEEFMKNLREFM